MDTYSIDFTHIGEECENIVGYLISHPNLVIFLVYLVLLSLLYKYIQRYVSAEVHRREATLASLVEENRRLEHEALQLQEREREQNERLQLQMKRLKAMSMWLNLRTACTKRSGWLEGEPVDMLPIKLPFKVLYPNLDHTVRMDLKFHFVYRVKSQEDLSYSQACYKAACDGD